MRAFYIFWFFFCCGWGYLLAGFAEASSPTWQQVAASVPVCIAAIAVLFLIELHRMPSGQRSSAPSLSLKPWQRPTGSLLFGSLTFLFSGLWGTVLAPLLGAPGFRVAVQFLVFGASGVVAIYAVKRALPAKFGA
jgi:hypothetical protein